MAATAKTKTERKELAERIAEMRRQGKRWPEIITATKVRGPATGRKLMREFNLADAIVDQKRDGTKTSAQRGNKNS